VSAPDRERLAAYLDGELEPLERAAVERELEASEEARRVLAELAALDEMARSLPVEAPEGYFEALPGRVRARLESAGGRRRTLPAWAWAAAAALAVAALAPLTMSRLEDAAPPPAAVPPVTLLGESRSLPEPVTPAAPPRFAQEPAAEPPRAEPRPRPAATATPPAPAAQAPSRERRRDAAEAARPGAPSPAASQAPAVPELEAAPRQDRAESLRDASPAPVPPPAPAAAEEAADAAAPEGGARAADVAPRQVASDDRAETEVGAQAPAAASANAKRSASGLAVGADAERFTGLAERRPRSAAEARRLREDWRGFLLLYPESALADEARVRTVEAGLEAYRLSGEEADRTIARRDVQAYLRREDAAQPGRVEALLAALDR
jgi:hypothetical protein